MTITRSANVTGSRDGCQRRGRIGHESTGPTDAAQMVMPAVLSSTEGNASRAQASAYEHANRDRAGGLRGRDARRGRERAYSWRAEAGAAGFTGFASPYWIFVGQPCM